VEETLKQYINPKKNNWDENLDSTQFALNTSVNASGMTPFLINHGREARLPIDNRVGEELKLERREERSKST